MKKKLFGKLTVAFMIVALAMTSIAAAENGMIFERWMTGGSPDTMMTETTEPDETLVVPTSEWGYAGGVGGSEDGNDYRVRLTGWLVPPVTGTYYFWITTDDGGRIWLSENEEPDGAVLICQESTWRGPDSWGNIGDEEVSEAISLEAGKIYWIRGAFAEIGGGEHIRIGWQCDEAGIEAHTIIEGQYLLTALPPFAVNPDPEKNAADVPLDKVLTWETGKDPDDPNGVKPYPPITGHHVYFGTDRALVAARDASVYRSLKPVADADYNPADDGITMVIDEQYFWRIDESVNNSGPFDANSIEGFVWSFKSVRTIPDILAQPKDLTAVETLDGVFSMDIHNPVTGDQTGLTYEWKKVGDPAVLSSEAVFVIPTLTDSDEGQYYCTVSNANGFRDSDVVTLNVSAKVVQWNFDETAGTTAVDSSGNGIDGTLSSAFTDDNWIIDGGRTGNAGDNALDLAGSLETVVTAANVDLSSTGLGDIFAGDSSWTIRMWINPASSPGISMLGGFGRCDNVEGGPQNERYINAWDTSLEFQPGGNEGFWPGGNLGSGGWKMLTVAYDGASGVCTMYIDAEQIGTTSYAALADVTEKSIKVGAAGAVAWEVWDEGEPPVPVHHQVGFNGLIDDFCIYDGALTADDVLYLYSGYMCLADLAMDFDGDCAVGLSDMAILLEKWLVTHLVD